MRLSSDPELLLVSGGRHSREEQTASPGGKGWGLDANSGSTEERMKDLRGGHAEVVSARLNPSHSTVDVRGVCNFLGSVSSQQKF